MDRKLLNIINLLSIPVVLIILVISRFHILTGPLSLITIFPVYYVLILLYVNIREAVVHNNAVVQKSDELSAGPSGESRLKLIKSLLFIGVGVIGVIYLAISLIFIRNELIFTLQFILIILLLAFFISISFTFEFWVQRKVTINYNSAVLTVLAALLFGAFVWFFLPREQFFWYIPAVTISILSLYAYFRTKNVVMILKQIRNKPFNPRVEQLLKIAIYGAVIVIVGIVLLGSLFALYPISVLDLIFLLVKILIVISIAKVIWDIS